MDWSITGPKSVRNILYRVGKRRARGGGRRAGLAGTGLRQGWQVQRRRHQDDQPPDNRLDDLQPPAHPGAHAPRHRVRLQMQPGLRPHIQHRALRGFEPLFDECRHPVHAGESRGGSYQTDLGSAVPPSVR